MKTARRIAAAEALATIAGLATVVLGVATGNWPVVMAVGVIVAGAGLLAAIADLRETESRSGAARRLHQGETAIEQEQGRELGVKERLARLRTCPAHLDAGPEGGGGQFRERLAAEPESGWDRVR